MSDAIAKMACYLLIIALGYFLKRIRLFSVDDTGFLSRLILNVTLPAVLLTSFQGIYLTVDALLLPAVGLLCNLIPLAIAHLLAKRTDKLEQKLLWYLFVPAFNVATFGFPVAQAAFPAAMMTTLCLFDAGNAMVMFGGLAPISATVADPKADRSVKTILKRVVRSIPFDTYIVAIILSVLRLDLPGSVVTFAKMLGSGNAFLCMLLFGLMLDFNFGPGDLARLFKLLGVRLVVSAVLIALCWTLLPLPQDVKVGVVLCLVMPVSTASAVQAERLGCNKTFIACLTTVSLILSAIFSLAIAILFA